MTWVIPQRTLQFKYICEKSCKLKNTRVCFAFLINNKTTSWIQFQEVELYPFFLIILGFMAYITDQLSIMPFIVMFVLLLVFVLFCCLFCGGGFGQSRTESWDSVDRSPWWDWNSWGPIWHEVQINLHAEVPRCSK